MNDSLIIMNDSLIVNVGYGVYFGIIAAVITIAIAVTIFQILHGIVVLIGKIARGILGIED